jgi:hypothetical protein
MPITMTGITMTGGSQLLASSAPTGDPYYANVVLLANATDSQYIDQSQYAVALTPGTGVSIDSSRVAFAGTKSMKFTANNQGISLPYLASKFDLATTVTTWTVESWVYLEGAQSSIGTFRLDVVWSSGGPGSAGWETNISTGGQNVTYPGFGGPGVAQSVSSGAWYHMAWQRSSNTYTFCFNGNIQAQTYSGGKAAYPAIRIGANFNNNPGIIYNLQDLRMTNGVIRYPGGGGATYTVPTAPFPTN